MKIKKRLDVLLVEQGYADSRTKAQAIIMSGQVYVEGQKADNPVFRMMKMFHWKCVERPALM